MSEASEIAGAALLATCKELQGDMAREYQDLSRAVSRSSSALDYKASRKCIEATLVELQKATGHCYRWLALEQAFLLVDDSSFVDEIAALEPEVTS